MLFSCHPWVENQDEIPPPISDIAHVWNIHTIKPSKKINIASGQVNVMHTYCRNSIGPEASFSSVDDEHVQLCKEECVFQLTIPCDPDVYELCYTFMAESHLTLPGDPYQAVSLYMLPRGNP